MSQREFAAVYNRIRKSLAKRLRDSKKEFDLSKGKDRILKKRYRDAAKEFYAYGRLVELCQVLSKEHVRNSFIPVPDLAPEEELARGQPINANQRQYEKWYGFQEPWYNWIQLAHAWRAANQYRTPMEATPPVLMEAKSKFILSRKKSDPQ